MSSVIAQRKSNEKLNEYRKIEAEVQRLWRDSKVFEVNAPEEAGTEKFFPTFPYAYMNGKLHMGHALTASKVEFIASFQRMLGKKCLFPVGYHCTGMPIMACADKLKREIEMFGNPPKFPSDSEEASGDVADEKPDVENLMARDKSKGKKSKAQSKAGSAKYQWEIMRESLVLPEEQSKGLSDDEILAKLDEEIAKFVDPQHWFQYFPHEAKKDLQLFGASVDWRRSFITTDVNPFYDSFVRWQYLHLKRKDKIKFGKRHTIYSPKDGQPCMDHDRASGEGVQPQEFTLIKVKMINKIPILSKAGDQPVYLLAATLRPETMFGQTNIWLRPDMEYLAFRMINDEIGICSRRAALNMAYQDLTPTFGSLDIIADLTGMDLFGQPLEAPLAYNKIVYTLPMMNVKDDKGTGIITSVPTESPDDWIALSDLKNKPQLRQKYGITDEMVLPFEAIPIIDVAGYGTQLAASLCEELKIKSQNDREKLAEAKERAYLRGFHDGTMIVPGYEGKKVGEARKPIQKILVDADQAILYMEPEKQVMSRSGEECVVALCDQWYLDYENESWKNQVRKALDSMETFAEETRRGLESTVDWFRGHACSRTYGSGTRLPWDENWLIESLSDSTIYMSYYTIAHFLQDGNIVGSDTTSPIGIKPEQMTPAVWDFIFLGNDSGIGDCSIPRKNLDLMRREFLYWYPLDLRSSAKDLISNHLIYLLYIHCAIWEDQPEMWPRAIRSNGHLVLNGQKMSKSTGNFLTLAEAINLYGADAVRYALADTSDGIDDANFVDNQAETGLLKLFNYHKWCEETLASIDTLRSGDLTLFADRALNNALNKLLKETKEQYEKMMFREALRLGFFECQELRTKYKEMCSIVGLHGPLIRRFIETQAILINPICPHISQKIWQLLGHKDLLATTRWPDVEEFDENLHKAYEYLTEAVHEFRVRLRTYQTPAKQKKGATARNAPPKANKATIYVAKSFPPWQATICQTLYDLYIEHNGQLPDNKIISSKLAQCESLKKHAKKVMPFAELRKQIIQKLGEQAFNLTTPFDEVKVLEDNIAYLKNALEIDDIIIKNAEDSEDSRITEDCCPSRPLIIFSE